MIASSVYQGLRSVTFEKHLNEIFNVLSFCSRWMFYSSTLVRSIISELVSLSTSSSFSRPSQSWYSHWWWGTPGSPWQLYLQIEDHQLELDARDWVLKGVMPFLAYYGTQVNSEQRETASRPRFRQVKSGRKSLYCPSFSRTEFFWGRNSPSLSWSRRFGWSTPQEFIWTITC